MKEKTDPPNARRIYPVLALLIVGSALFLLRMTCFHPLDAAESLWSDEIGSVLIAQRPIVKLIGFVLLNDVNPPLPYLLLHFWMFLGTEDGFLRLLPFLFGLALLPAAFGLAKRIWNVEVGLYTLCFLIASPLLAYYSVELRYPTMLAFFATLSYGCLLTWIRTEGARGGGGYVLVSALAFYTHYTFLFLFAGQVLLAGIARKKLQARFAATLKKQLLVLVLALPAAAMALAQVARGNAWIKALAEPRGFFANIRDAFHYLSVGHSPKQPSTLWNWLDAVYRESPQRFWWIFFVASMPLILLFAKGLAAHVRETSRSIEKTAVLCFLGSAVLLPVAADCFSPIFSPKLLLPATVPFFIVVAAGWDRAMKDRKLLFLFFVFFVFASMVGSLLQYRKNDAYHRDDWKGVARLIQQQERPGDALFNFDFEMDYYYRGGAPSVSVFPVAPRQLARQGFDLPPDQIEPMVQELLSKYKRLWIRRNQHRRLRWLDEVENRLLGRTVDLSPPETKDFNIPLLLVGTNPALATEALAHVATSRIDFTEGRHDPRQLRGHWLATDDGWAWTTNGSSAVLARSPNGNEVVVDVFANSDLFPGKRAEVELYVNGKRMTGREVDGPERFVLTGEVPGGVGIVEIQIRCDKVILPDLNGGVVPSKQRTVLIRRMELLSR